MAESAVGRQTALLAMEDVAVHFGGVKAVDGITLEMYEGNIYGVIGPNGSGKSTLLGAMTRLTPSTRGRFLLDGKDYTRVPARNVHRMGISRTFQTVRLLDDRSVRDNILLGLDALPKQTRKETAMQVDEVMERVGVREVAQLRPDELSYGMQRRVEFARAIIGRPRLLLLDEPTAGMNTAERKEIGKLMRQLCDEGITQFIVEHDVEMMVETCDYLFAMNVGKLIAEGEPQDVVRHPAVQEAYLGKGAAADA
ncbi:MULTISPECIES: ATP-binding cassette domain-containing protein [Thermocrispum]|jgi:ABC-type branched-subunit amino acid transport system ATPase component|uniref:ATP-binding cassette domain-containing protein n=2 Tax=Thermocrispum agreste TaxID=37925 RepID=A0ABD6FDQ3_9PSEU|nr:MULTISPECIES: ATP-binding cassette domain-containing protein [Thermocrispum]